MGIKFIIGVGCIWMAMTILISCFVAATTGKPKPVYAAAAMIFMFGFIMIKEKVND